MSFAIWGTGTALPASAVTQTQAVNIAQRIGGTSAEDSDLVAGLYRHTAIEKRHLAFDRDVLEDVLQGTRHTGSIFLPRGDGEDPGPTTGQRMAYYRERAAPLALKAAAQALRESGLEPDDLTHLITVSCTGFHAPGVDYELIQSLELSPGIERTHVGFMGCHGALNGLRVARALAGSEPTARVLLCAVELCSLHYHYPYSPKKLVANALFADGAAAVVGGPAAAGPVDAWRVSASGSWLVPDSAAAMTWHIGDHGFEMTLSTRVPHLILEQLRPWLKSWLQKQGLGIENVASWAVHPGGPRILSAVAEALRLGPEALDSSRHVLQTCGNMSSPTVLFILRELRAGGATLPCVALAFGPGLVAEAALIT